MNDQEWKCVQGFTNVSTLALRRATLRVFKERGGILTTDGQCDSLVSLLDDIKTVSTTTLNRCLYGTPFVAKPIESLTTAFWRLIRGK